MKHSSEASFCSTCAAGEGITAKGRRSKQLVKCLPTSELAEGEGPGAA
jgi:hypothetical protein